MVTYPGKVDQVYQVVDEWWWWKWWAFVTPNTWIAYRIMSGGSLVVIILIYYNFVVDHILMRISPEQNREITKIGTSNNTICMLMVSQLTKFSINLNCHEFRLWQSIVNFKLDFVIAYVVFVVIGGCTLIGRSTGIATIVTTNVLVVAQISVILIVTMTWRKYLIHNQRLTLITALCFILFRYTQIT